MTLRIVDYNIRQATDNDLRAIQLLLQPFIAARKLLKRTKAELQTLIANGFVAEVLEVPLTEHGEAVESTSSDVRPATTDSIESCSVSKIVGFSAIEIYSRKLSEVQCLAVDENYHGRGIGSDLVNACIGRARERGVLEVMAISASDNFLRQLGFQYALPDQKRALFYQLKTRDELNAEIIEDE